MNLKTLSIPDQISEIGGWLDDQLVSPDLIETIVQLEVLAGNRLSTVQSLDGVLATDRTAVLERGLTGVPETTIRAFLRQPALLLELQEQVLMHGGDYWQTKTDAKFGVSETSGLALGSPSTEEVKAPKQVTTEAGGNVRQTPVAGWSRKKVFGAIAALAAAVLIMAFIARPNGSSVAKSGWGFSESGLLESDITESEMLERLAAASAAWHKKQPATPETLAKRLREFDNGCQALLASNLPQLSASNRAAVHAACEKCRTSIATQLAALDGGVDFNLVHSESDKAIDRLTRSIKNLS